MNLHDRIGDIAGRKEHIAESQSITTEEARQLIKDCSFKEYLDLTEANADRGVVGTQTTQNAAPDNEQPDMSTPRQPEDAESATQSSDAMSGSDKEKEFDDALKQFDSPTDQNELKNIKDLQDTDPDEAQRRLDDFEKRNPTSDLDKIKDMFGTARNKFAQGFNREVAKENSDLERIRELAGVKKNENQ